MAAHDIKGKTCLITGGASGMGTAYVEAYLREGAKFVAIVDIAEDKGTALAKKLSETYPGKVEFIKCDISDEASITAAFNTIVDKVKQLDIIINNAGIANDTPNMWRTSCNVNWLGVVSFTLKGVKHMRKDQGGAGGAIINISSVVAFLTVAPLPTYNGCKAAVLHFTRCLAQDPFHEKTGIRVMAICINVTDTPMVPSSREGVIDPMHSKAVDDILGTLQMQRPESAAAVCMTVFKNGANGSVWISQNDAPAQDITATITKGYELLQSVIEC